MKIANNSGLIYQITLSNNNNKNFTKTLLPGERITDSALCSEKDPSLRKYYKMVITQSDKQVVSRSFVESNTYVALLGPVPRAEIYFEEDNSEEAKRPLPEMVNVIAGAIHKYIDYQLINTPMENLVASPQQQFRLFVCYSMGESPDSWNKLMRVEQAWEAFKQLMYLDANEKMESVGWL